MQVLEARSGTVTSMQLVPSVQDLAVQFKRQLESLGRQTACHPKMMALQSAVLEHFRLPQASDTPGQGCPQQGEDMVPGRIIIFSSLRESVTEILAMLAKHEPYIRARHASLSELDLQTELSPLRAWRSGRDLGQSLDCKASM